MRIVSFGLLLLSLTLAAGEQVDSAAIVAFERAYEAGAAAAKAKNWKEVEVQMGMAIYLLRGNAHPKREVADILLRKARDIAESERAIVNAEELLKLEQWKEAELAFQRASRALGMTDRVKAGLTAATDGMRKDGQLAFPELTPEQSDALRLKMRRDVKQAFEAIDKGEYVYAQTVLDDVELAYKRLPGEEPAVKELRDAMRKLRRISPLERDRKINAAPLPAGAPPQAPKKKDDF